MENGDETDFTWLRDPERRTFNGLVSVLVRARKGAKGRIVLSVASSGLAAGTCELAVE